MELIEKENVTESGIVLTSANSEEASRGLVLAIGPNVLDVKEGDTVLPNWNQARKVKHDNKEYFIVSEKEIVLIFD
jgi:co-chaperonin GroES (HSP10)